MSAPKQDIKEAKHVETGLDDMLLYFAKVAVTQVTPRLTSGKVRVDHSGTGIVTVNLNEHVSRVFFKLVTEGFLSCPVVDSSNHFVAMLDMFDLVRFTLDLFEGSSNDSKTKTQETKQQQEQQSQTQTQSQQGQAKTNELEQIAIDWAQFFSDHKLFLEARVKDVLEHRGPRPTVAPISSRYSILNAMEMFAAGSPRRVPICNDQNQIIGICTQSMIISLLSQGLSLMPSLKHKPVSAIYKGTPGQVFSIRSDAPALDGFKLMMARNVQGIAVVDKDGALVDDLSVRDLRGIGTDAAHWKRLQLDVLSFKKAIRADEGGKKGTSIVSVTSKDTFEKVVTQMDDGNVHRVWEIAPQTAGSGYMKPVACISQIDVIRYVLESSGVGSQPLLPLK